MVYTDTYNRTGIHSLNYAFTYIHIHIYMHAGHTHTYTKIYKHTYAHTDVDVILHKLACRYILQARDFVYMYTYHGACTYAYVFRSTYI